MKYLFLLFCLGYFLHCTSQEPEPELFQTWYLHFILSTDLNLPYEISEIEPPIYPFITIEEDLSFHGEGACNSFNGIYNFYPPENLDNIEFTPTTNECDVEIHNLVEEDFFQFIQTGGWYQITEEADGFELEINNVLMGYAIFKNYPLSITDFHLPTVTVYPNPVVNSLKVHSSRPATKEFELKVLDITGKTVLTAHMASGETQSILEVDTLNSGMYFLDIKRDDGISQIIKFVKK